MVDEHNRVVACEKQQPKNPERLPCTCGHSVRGIKDLARHEHQNGLIIASLNRYL